MSTNITNPKNIDIKTLLENLKDLDQVSRKITREVDRKNRIFESGLRDCKNCKKFIDLLFFKTDFQ